MLKKVLPPVLLVGVGAWLLVGCIYIPTFGPVVKGVDVSKKVGEANSKKPVRRFEATRDDVIRLLGRPAFETLSGRDVVYWWRVRNGFVSYPQCLFFGNSLYGDRALVLHFDDAGALQSYRVEKRDDPLFDIPNRGEPPEPWIPEEFYADQHAQSVRRAWDANDRSATRPSDTRPLEGAPAQP